MKAVLLAAGKGERLGARAGKVPKPMVQLGGKPVIGWNVELCQRHGVTELFINLHHLPDVIVDYLGDGSKFGVTITYAHEAELKGTAGGVKQFTQQLDDAPFFVIYADNWSDYDLSILVKCHDAARADMTIALFRMEDVRDCGVAILDADDRIIEFVEKPGDSVPSHWVSAGIYITEPSLLHRIPNGYCDFARDVIPTLIDEGWRLVGMKLDVGVTAIDTPELFERARRENPTPDT